MHPIQSHQMEKNGQATDRVQYSPCTKGPKGPCPGTLPAERPLPDCWGNLAETVGRHTYMRIRVLLFTISAHKAAIFCPFPQILFPHILYSVIAMSDDSINPKKNKNKLYIVFDSRGLDMFMYIGKCTTKFCHFCKPRIYIAAYDRRQSPAIRRRNLATHRFQYATHFHHVVLVFFFLSSTCPGNAVLHNITARRHIVTQRSAYAVMQRKTCSRRLTMA